MSAAVLTSVTMKTHIVRNGPSLSMSGSALISSRRLAYATHASPPVCGTHRVQSLEDLPMWSGHSRKLKCRTQRQRRVFGALHVSTQRAKTLQVQTERRVACCRPCFLGTEVSCTVGLNRCPLVFCSRCKQIRLLSGWYIPFCPWRPGFVLHRSDMFFI